jgi:hypothetical protein
MYWWGVRPPALLLAVPASTSPSEGLRVRNESKFLMSYSLDTSGKAAPRVYLLFFGDENPTPSFSDCHFLHHSIGHASELLAT